MATTIKFRSAFFMLTVASLLAVTSCKKKEKEPEPQPQEQPDTDQATATDNQTAEVIASDIEAIGGQASEESAVSNFRESGALHTAALDAAPCATVLINTAARIFTVDFGTTGCVGNDGRTRTGKLIYDYSASNPTTAVYYRNPGFKMTVTSQNYVVDAHSVTINSKTVENITPANIPQGTNPGTNLKWKISASISVVKPSNGGTIAWTCDRTKELLNTSDTTCYRGQSLHIIWANAKIRINGAASGTNVKGESYSATATNLDRDFQCHPEPLRPRWSPFISGTLAYTPANKLTRTIDYGSGSCDKTAVITVGNVTATLTLH